MSVTACSTVHFPLSSSMITIQRVRSSRRPPPHHDRETAARFAATQLEGTVPAVQVEGCRELTATRV